LNRWGKGKGGCNRSCPVAALVVKLAGNEKYFLLSQTPPLLGRLSPAATARAQSPAPPWPCKDLPGTPESFCRIQACSKDSAARFEAGLIPR